MLTPREILQTEFRTSFRGYHTKDVDSFVRKVVQAYETLTREKKELTERIEELEEIIREEGRDADRRAELLRVAQENAFDIIEKAEKQAEQILADAARREEEILERVRAAEEEAAERIARLQAYERRVRGSLRTLLEEALQHIDAAEEEEEERYGEIVESVVPVEDEAAAAAEDLDSPNEPDGQSEGEPELD